MTDSVTTLQSQIAVLHENPDDFIHRCPTAEVANGEKGPAVRELVYAHAQDADRRRMARIEEAIVKIKVQGGPNAGGTKPLAWKEAWEDEHTKVQKIHKMGYEGMS